MLDVAAPVASGYALLVGQKPALPAYLAGKRALLRFAEGCARRVRLPECDREQGHLPTLVLPGRPAFTDSAVSQYGGSRSPQYGGLAGSEY
jgi:hypothetical protein